MAVGGGPARIGAARAAIRGRPRGSPPRNSGLEPSTGRRTPAGAAPLLSLAAHPQLRASGRAAQGPPLDALHEEGSTRVYATLPDKTVQKYSTVTGSPTPPMVRPVTGRPCSRSILGCRAWRMVAVDQEFRERLKALQARLALRFEELRARYEEAAQIVHESELRHAPPRRPPPPGKPAEPSE